MVAAGLGWSMLYIKNVSDTTVYVQWSEESTPLTTANGVPIAANGELRIPASDAPRRPAVNVIHGGSGNKELRYVAE